MLYVTTRNDQQVYTAHRALTESRGPDGGLYVPFRDPVISKEDIVSLREKSFNRCVADVLNILFQTKLTSWDVDFAMTEDPENTWTSEPIEMKAGQEYKVRQGKSWDVNFGSDGMNGANFVVEADGTYQVVMVWDGAESAEITLVPVA